MTYSSYPSYVFPAAPAAPDSPPQPTPVCVDGTCAECPADNYCPAGKWCDSGKCVSCTPDDPAHCGVTCETCWGTAPACIDGHCRCAGDSCGPYQACDSGKCALCNTAERCGETCQPCPAELPFCRFDALGCARCLAAGPMQVVSIYLTAGDRLSALLTPMDSLFDATLQVRSGDGCSIDAPPAQLLSCSSASGDGGPETLDVTAQADGWVTVVIGGVASGREPHDFGFYLLDLELECAREGCCCLQP